MLRHQGLVRHCLLEEENRMGAVWKWDLHLVHLLKVGGVCAIRHNLSPDPCCFQVKRLQQESRAFSMESPHTRLRGGRKPQDVHNRSTDVNTTPCGF